MSMYKNWLFPKNIKRDKCICGFEFEHRHDPNVKWNHHYFYDKIMFIETWDGNELLCYVKYPPYENNDCKEFCKIIYNFKNKKDIT